MITIYSKDNCEYCTKAKKILYHMKNEEGLEHEITYIHVSNNELAAFRDAFPKARTMPYILVDGVDIGGCAGLESMRALRSLSI